MLKNLFAYPFRIFFVSAGVYALLAVPLWVGLLSGALNVPLGVAWHAHELLAGLLYAGVAGFLLTAVCNWTSTPPVAGARLFLLWLLWLLPRGWMLFGVDSVLVVIVDLLFLPAVIACTAFPVAQKRQWRQLPILLTLCGLWLVDLGYHLSADPRYLHLALSFAALLILLVGSRIAPAFSRNWLRARGRDIDSIRDPRWLTASVYTLTCLFLGAELIALVSGSLIAPTVIAGLALLASAAIILRLGFWSPWLVREEPLLWILYLAMLWLPVGLTLRAAAVTALVPAAAWQHALSVGAIGTLLIGVMSRVALGHTGRPLEIHPQMVFAFLLISVAAVLRVLTALNWLDWRLGLMASGVAWCLAFLLFVWRYTPILIRPRPDGKPG